MTFWRLEVFVVLVSGIVERPLPPPELVGSVAEMVRDLDKKSLAQRMRPHPRWRYARNLVWHGGAVAAAFAATAGFLCHDVLGAVVGAMLGLASVLALKVAARVMAALGGPELNPLPPCDIIDPVVMATITPGWAECPPRRLKRCDRQLGANSLENGGRDCWAHTQGWPCPFVHTNQPELIAELEQQEQTLARDSAPTTMVQQMGSNCGIATISSAFRSISGAEQLFIRYSPYRTFLSLPAAVAAVQSLAACWPGAPVSTIKVVGGKWAVLVSGVEFRRELVAAQSVSARLLVMYSIAAVESKKVDLPWIDRLEDLSAAHWSLVVWYDLANDVVALYDPRPCFGMRLVPAERLLAAINTRCCVTFRRRGMVRISF
jgi:hypothetical protein